MVDIHSRAMDNLEWLERRLVNERFWHSEQLICKFWILRHFGHVAYQFIFRRVMILCDINSVVYL